MMTRKQRNDEFPKHNCPKCRPTATDMDILVGNARKFDGDVVLTRWATQFDRSRSFRASSVFEFPNQYSHEFDHIDRYTGKIMTEAQAEHRFGKRLYYERNAHRTVNLDIVKAEGRYHLIATIWDRVNQGYYQPGRSNPNSRVLAEGNVKKDLVKFALTAKHDFLQSLWHTSVPLAN